MNKTMLITGASSGLGLAKAKYFAKKGYIVFAGVRKQEDYERLLSQGLRAILLDVTDSDSIRSAYGKVAERGGLDYLINNAGVAFSGALEVMDEHTIETLMSTNLMGAINTTKTLLPLLRQQRGRILFIGSISGRFAPPGLSVYAASKFALEGLADSLRVELGALGIKVSIIEPGKIDTPIWEKGVQYSQSIESKVDVATYHAIDRYYQHYAEKEKGTAIERYLSVVNHAVAAPRPKPRYLLNNGSRFRVLLDKLPSFWRDSLVKRAMKL